MTQMLMGSILGLELALVASSPVPTAQSPWLLVLFALTALAACRAAMADKKDSDQNVSPRSGESTPKPRGVRHFVGPRDRRA